MPLADLSARQADGIGKASIFVGAIERGFVVTIGHSVAFPGRKEQILFEAVLFHIEIKITPLHGVKLLVSAALHNLALLDDQNLIGAADGGEAMGDHKSGPP